MKYGVSIIPNTGIMPITELALGVEQRGLDALFMGDRVQTSNRLRPYGKPRPAVLGATLGASGFWGRF
jgi:hypothetical protein